MADGSMQSILLDREKLRDHIKMVLTQAETQKKRFLASELYGLAGLGKTEVLEEAKRQCRECQLPFASFDFLADKQGMETENSKYALILRICDQLDHYFPLPKARAVLSLLVRHSADQENTSDPLQEFHALLVQALEKNTFILMLDSIEQCSQELFDWFGQEFLAPLLNQGTFPIILFLAGRGPRIFDSRWPRAMKADAVSFRLDPLSFQVTQEQIRLLTTEERLHRASNKIYDLSNGHPYSTQMLVRELEKLGVEADEQQQESELARRLYDGVIQQYILAQDKDGWILPFLETACVPRGIDPGFLKQLFYSETKSEQPVQWYITRLAELQEQPWHLVNVTQTAYELDPLLRRLLHKALAILRPEEMIAIHKKAKVFYEELFNREGQPAKDGSVIVEILYHRAESALIAREANPGKSVEEDLKPLLERFSPTDGRDVAELNRLRDLIKSDVDLLALLGKETVTALIGYVEDYLQSFQTELRDFKRSYLTIDHQKPSTYIVSWYHSNQVVLSQETIHSELKLPIGMWRKSLEKIGRTAYKAYLPAKAQIKLKQHPEYALELSTNTNDIPWELLHDGDEFLCLSRPMGRKPKMNADPRVHNVIEKEHLLALVVGDPNDNLPKAREEAKEVARLLRKQGWQVDELIGTKEARADEFVIQVTNTPYDLIHFAGHGFYNPKNPSTSCIFFAEEKSVFAEEFERILCSPAFLFFSACNSAEGKTVSIPGGDLMEGVAVSALLGGAIGCLGPIWEIEDGTAKEFALAFYRTALRGMAIGEAVRQARLKVRNASVDTWASWILYGDPLRTLLTKEESRN